MKTSIDEVVLIVVIVSVAVVTLAILALVIKNVVDRKKYQKSVIAEEIVSDSSEEEEPEDEEFDVDEFGRTKEEAEAAAARESTGSLDAVIDELAPIDSGAACPHREDTKVDVGGIALTASTSCEEGSSGGDGAKATETAAVMMAMPVSATATGKAGLKLDERKKISPAKMNTGMELISLEEQSAL